MTEKRFKVNTVWFNKEKTDGEHIIEYINGQPLIATKSLEDAKFVKALLNGLYKENEQLKNILKDIIIQLNANHTLNTYTITVPVNRVIYNELCRRLKESSFNEELKRFLE